MGHYSDKSESIRVDFFKSGSGKWYLTEAVIWTGDYNEGLIHEEFAKSLHDHLFIPATKILRLSDMNAVCLEPYHKHEHPMMMHVNEIEGVLLRKRERDIRALGVRFGT